MTSKGPHACVVQVPTTAQQLDQVRSLMRSFIAWHKDRHREDMRLIDAYFDAEAFEQELASLPGKYAPPHGQLLLATVDDSPAGCVALREIDSASCEMKRMFVRPAYRGNGFGKKLTLAILDEALDMGYERVRLDTAPTMHEAIRLYEAIGFRRIEPYRHYPVADVIFMEVVLHSREKPLP